MSDQSSVADILKKNFVFAADYFRQECLKDQPLGTFSDDGWGHKIFAYGDLLCFFTSQLFGRFGEYESRIFCFFPKTAIEWLDNLLAPLKEPATVFSAYALYVQILGTLVVNAKLDIRARFADTDGREMSERDRRNLLFLEMLHTSCILTALQIKAQDGLYSAAREQREWASDEENRKIKELEIALDNAGNDEVKKSLERQLDELYAIKNSKKGAWTEPMDEALQIMDIIYEHLFHIGMQLMSAGEGLLQDGHMRLSSEYQTVSENCT